LSLRHLFTGILASTGAAQAPTGAFPTEHGHARADVVAFGTSPSSRMTEHGTVRPTGAGDARLLAGGDDAEACARLHAWVDASTSSSADRWRRTFYRVGGHHYPRADADPEAGPGGARRLARVGLGFDPPYVLDLSLQPVARTAM
jgi:hypothetical protein